MCPSTSCAGCPIALGQSEPTIPKFTRESRVAQRSVFVLKYRYDIPEWAKAELTQYQALVAYLKSGISKQMVFDLIPFSFVLQWFLNADALVSGNMFGYSSDQMHATVSIVDACLFYQIEEGTTVKGQSVRHGSSYEHAVRKYAYRWVGPTAVNHLNWIIKLPSFMQFALMGALGLSNVKFWS